MGGSASGVASGDQTEAEMLLDVGLWTVLREDFAHHNREWTRAGLQALWVHRLGAYSRAIGRPWRYVFTLIHAIGHLICRNLYGIEIERSVQIGRRMFIAHQHGIVVHKYARFGDDCMIRQCVTLGFGNEWVRDEGPVIGNNVAFGVGSVVVGSVTIGDNVQIGPNSVVMNDVPANRSLFIAPPRMIPTDADTASAKRI